MAAVNIRDLVAGQGELLTLSSSASIGDALALFKKHRILGAPVIDDAKTIVGFVDTLDVLSELVRVSRTEISDRTSPPSTSLKTDDLEQLMVRANEFKLAPIGRHLDGSGKDPLMILDGDLGVDAAVRHFATGIHRAIVTVNTDAGVKLHILTQHTLISWIAQYAEIRLQNAGASFPDATMRDLGCIKSVVSCPDTTPAIDAFQLMHDNGVTSIALLDTAGALSGTLSASDLRFVADRWFIWLLEPASKYIEFVRKEAGEKIGKLVVVDEVTSLIDVVKKVAEAHVHRVFILDYPERKPIGVCSLSDICAAIQQQRDSW